MMRQAIPYILATGLCLVAISQSTDHSPVTGVEDPSAPSDWFFRQRAYPRGQVDRQSVLRARTDGRRRSAVLRSGPDWQPAGPTNIPGRITDVELWPGDPDKLLVGAASGGLFLTEDAGRSWQPLFDDQVTLAIGDLAIAPTQPNIIYVGTGEANAGGGSIAYDGAGIYLSEDGGQTWSARGLSRAGSIGRIVVDPRDPDRAYAAAMGQLFANNPQRGLYRTTDRGRTWERILYRSDSTGAIDVVIHPTQPDILYASLWERVRRPQRRSYGGSTSGLFRSEDGGDSWTEITAGVPRQPARKGRIGIAVSPAAPDMLLAYYVRRDGFLKGIYRSPDRGETWESLPIDGIRNVSFMWWFGRVAIHPDDPRRLYAFGLDLYQWDPDQRRWTVIFPGVHVDQHALVFDPQDPDRLILGNDGGIYISEDGGLTSRHCANMPITQFYTVTIDPTDPHRRYGGTQDNGTMRTPSGQQDDWEVILGADGFRVLIDPSNPNIIYAEAQNGALYRSTSGGRSFFQALSGIAPSDRRNWSTPIAMDPNNPRTLYYGTQRLYRSTNRAYSWTPISPDLTRGDGGGNIAYGTLTSISVSPLDQQLVYTATDDGKVWRTDAARRESPQNTWVDLSGHLPRRWVTAVLASPNHPDEVYVTLSGFRFGENIGHVYHSTDRGSTWRRIDQDLPDIPVNDIIVTPDEQIFLATDAGVYTSRDQGRSWQPDLSGMPAVVVADLDYHPESGQLVAGTYGRSMYQKSLKFTTTAVEAQESTSELMVWPNPAREVIHIQWRRAAPGPGHLRLLDLQGRLLKRRTIDPLSSSLELTVPVADLPPGTYLVQWWQGQVPVANARFVRQ